MDDLWVYISEGGLGAGLLFLIYKYAIPAMKSLYNELKDLRKENAELREKLAFFKGKYTDKVILRSHGKDKRKDEQGEKEI